MNDQNFLEYYTARRRRRETQSEREYLQTIARKQASSTARKSHKQASSTARKSRKQASSTARKSHKQARKQAHNHYAKNLKRSAHADWAEEEELQRYYANRPPLRVPVDDCRPYRSLQYENTIITNIIVHRYENNGQGPYAHIAHNPLPSAKSNAEKREDAARDARNGYALRMSRRAQRAHR